MHRESLVPKKLTCMLYHHNEEDVRMLDFGDVCFRQPCGPCWMQLRHWSTVAAMSVLRDELWQEKDLDFKGLCNIVRSFSLTLSPFSSRFPNSGSETYTVSCFGCPRRRSLAFHRVGSFLCAFVALKD
uniref:Uncharacterized protein n=1 Tax=Tetraselmis sp. GSL018 TaxID=582737 RepID=A0A061RV02_9CHLO